jgi:hypothetical protein
MQVYLCYDIRGIQQSIFAVPRLKYIIGGSALIDGFDRHDTLEIAEATGAKRIYGGGGRGAFCCADDRQAQMTAEKVVHAVQALGLDVRLGMDRNLAKATSTATNLYSYAVDNLDGEPCAVSGLFPVPSNDAKPGRRGVHPILTQRAVVARKDPVGTDLLRHIAQEGGLPADLVARGPVRFMTNVSPDTDDSPEEQALARQGQHALGARNRWAVIAMDGNDMGRQHRAAVAQFGQDSERHTQWLKGMSKGIDDSTRGAVALALGEMATRWWQDFGCENTADGPVILPFRPLLVGGDDILVLSHCSYAMELVNKVSQHFSRLGEAAHRAADGGLWLGTGGKLTISAGVLYVSTSFPLATAIGYTEALLASAKSKGREAPAEGKPAPPAVDWEQITEGAIDSPWARRTRELRFKDGDDGDRDVFLTCRPWLISDLADRLGPRMDTLRAVPKSTRQELLSGLRQPAWERMRFLARLRKNHPSLYTLLEYQPGAHPGRGWQLDRSESSGPAAMRTDLLDAVLLLEEEHRMGQETAP